MFETLPRTLAWIPLLSLICACTGEPVKDEAIKSELEQRGIVYTKKVFLQHVQKNDLEVVELFLKAGIGVDRVLRQRGSGKTPSGRTALMLAAREGHLEMVQLLLDHGADIDEEAFAFRGPPNDGMTPLYFASQEGHLPIVELLLAKGAKVDVSTRPFGRTALSQAAHNGHAEIVKRLLAKGADTSATLRGGDTGRTAWEAGMSALLLAADQGKVEAVDALLAGGAKIDARKEDGHDALMLAALKNEPEVVRHLLAAGASLEAMNGEGLTPLMLTARRGKPEMVQLLIDHGAKLEQRDQKWGWTALFFAVQQKREPAIKTLLAAGADPEAKATDGKTLITLARSIGGEDLVRLIETATPSPTVEKAP